jgi:HlyD family secretion protein
MRRARNAWRMGWIGSGLLLAMAVTSGTSRSTHGRSWFGPKPVREYATTPVRRTDLNVTLVAGGRVDSAEKTIIECELEAMAGMSWGSSTILSLVPEGTKVKKGDVLCSLDASRFEEAVRLQEIYVGQVRADFTKAELNLEVAKLAVVEYREGLMQEALTALKGQIALTRADHERAVDRLGWVRRMLQKGYLSRAQVATEQSNVAHIEHNLKMTETALQMFEVWTAPKSLKILDAGVLMAQSIYNYQTSRLAQAEDRLQFFQEQVEACTIKAPHDGFVIYYTYPQWPDFRIKEGTIVLRTQKLFYLPDLGRMEVAAKLHETVVKDVHPGMKASVKVEGLPGRVIEGHVDSIAALPSQQWFSDVTYFDLLANG